MRGMSRTMGKALSGIDHLRQRLMDALTTPRGTRVILRDYGSDLPYLVDGHMSPQFAVQAYGVVAETVQRPVNGLRDFRLQQVKLISHTEDGMRFNVSGHWLPANENVSLILNL